MTGAAQRIAYFGKLPGCGDFVRSPGDQVLVELTDQWLANAMQGLSANPRWRQHYDACPPIDFAFIGTRSRQVVGGHLLASRDQSERRFPFACLWVHQVAQPREFLPCSPLAMAPAWAGLAAAASAASAGDPRRPESLAAAGLPDLAAARAQLERYLAGACLADLEAALPAASGAAPARRLLLALGLLLSPLRRRTPMPSRCLALPLPQDAAPRLAVASFWMTLAAPLLARQDLELAMFLTCAGGQPSLVLGMDGANPASLRAVIDPEAARESMVFLGDCGWVEAALGSDPALQRLAACLEQDQLGLPAAIQLFGETFC